MKKQTTTPRNYTQAKNEGWVTKRVNDGNHGKVRVDLVPRFYNGGKAIVSFWITYTGAKRLGLQIDY
jgi:hypothetical protein